MIGNLKLRSCMINMDTEKDYGEAHLNPLQRQNMRIFIEATKSLMDSVGEEGFPSVRLPQRLVTTVRQSTTTSKTWMS